MSSLPTASQDTWITDSLPLLPDPWWPLPASLTPVPSTTQSLVDLLAQALPEALSSVSNGSGRAQRADLRMEHYRELTPPELLEHIRPHLPAVLSRCAIMSIKRAAARAGTVPERSEPEYPPPVSAGAETPFFGAWAAPNVSEAPSSSGVSRESIEKIQAARQEELAMYSELVAQWDSLAEFAKESRSSIVPLWNTNSATDIARILLICYRLLLDSWDTSKGLRQPDVQHQRCIAYMMNRRINPIFGLSPNLRTVGQHMQLPAWVLQQCTPTFFRRCMIIWQDGIRRTRRAGGTPFLRAEMIWHAAEKYMQDVEQHTTSLRLLQGPARAEEEKRPLLLPEEDRQAIQEAALLQQAEQRFTDLQIVNQVAEAEALLRFVFETVKESRSYFSDMDVSAAVWCATDHVCLRLQHYQSRVNTLQALDQFFTQQRYAMGIDPPALRRVREAIEDAWNTSEESLPADSFVRVALSRTFRNPLVGLPRLPDVPGGKQLSAGERLARDLHFPSTLQRAQQFELHYTEFFQQSLAAGSVGSVGGVGSSAGSAVSAGTTVTASASNEPPPPPISTTQQQQQQQQQQQHSPSSFSSASASGRSPALQFYVDGGEPVTDRFDALRSYHDIYHLVLCCYLFHQWSIPTTIYAWQDPAFQETYFRRVYTYAQLFALYPPPTHGLQRLTRVMSEGERVGYKKTDAESAVLTRENTIRTRQYLLRVLSLEDMLCDIAYPSGILQANRAIDIDVNSGHAMQTSFERMGAFYYAAHVRVAHALLDAERELMDRALQRESDASRREADRSHLYLSDSAHQNVWLDWSVAERAHAHRDGSEQYVPTYMRFFWNPIHLAELASLHYDDATAVSLSSPLSSLSSAGGNPRSANQRTMHRAVSEFQRLRPANYNRFHHMQRAINTFVLHVLRTNAPPFIAAGVSSEFLSAMLQQEHIVGERAGARYAYSAAAYGWEPPAIGRPGASHSAPGAAAASEAQRITLAQQSILQGETFTRAPRTAGRLHTYLGERPWDWPPDVPFRPRAQPLSETDAWILAGLMGHGMFDRIARAVRQEDTRFASRSTWVNVDAVETCDAFIFNGPELAKKWEGRIEASEVFRAQSYAQWVRNATRVKGIEDEWTLPGNVNQPPEFLPEESAEEEEGEEEEKGVMRPELNPEEKRPAGRKRLTAEQKRPTVVPRGIVLEWPSLEPPHTETLFAWDVLPVPARVLTDEEVVIEAERVAARGGWDLNRVTWEQEEEEEEDVESVAPAAVRPDEAARAIRRQLESSSERRQDVKRGEEKKVKNVVRFAFPRARVGNQPSILPEDLLDNDEALREAEEARERTLLESKESSRSSETKSTSRTAGMSTTTTTARIAQATSPRSGLPSTRAEGPEQLRDRKRQLGLENYRTNEALRVSIASAMRSVGMEPTLASSSASAATAAAAAALSEETQADAHRFKQFAAMLHALSIPFEQAAQKSVRSSARASSALSSAEVSERTALAEAPAGAPAETLAVPTNLMYPLVQARATKAFGDDDEEEQTVPSTSTVSARVYHAEYTLESELPEVDGTILRILSQSIVAGAPLTFVGPSEEGHAVIYVDPQYSNVCGFECGCDMIIATVLWMRTPEPRSVSGIPRIWEEVMRCAFPILSKTCGKTMDLTAARQRDLPADMIQSSKSILPAVVNYDWGSVTENLVEAAAHVLHEGLPGAQRLADLMQDVERRRKLRRFASEWLYQKTIDETRRPEPVRFSNDFAAADETLGFIQHFDAYYQTTLRDEEDWHRRVARANVPWNTLPVQPIELEEQGTVWFHGLEIRHTKGVMPRDGYVASVFYVGRNQRLYSEQFPLAVLTRSGWYWAPGLVGVSRVISDFVKLSWLSYVEASAKLHEAGVAAVTAEPARELLRSPVPKLSRESLKELAPTVSEHRARRGYAARMCYEGVLGYALDAWRQAEGDIGIAFYPCTDISGLLEYMCDALFSADAAPRVVLDNMAIRGMRLRMTGEQFMCSDAVYVYRMYRRRVLEWMRGTLVALRGRAESLWTLATGGGENEVQHAFQQSWRAEMSGGGSGGGGGGGGGGGVAGASAPVTSASAASTPTASTPETKLLQPTTMYRIEWRVPVSFTLKNSYTYETLSMRQRQLEVLDFAVPSPRLVVLEDCHAVLLDESVTGDRERQLILVFPFVDERLSSSAVLQALSALRNANRQPIVLYVRMPAVETTKTLDATDLLLDTLTGSERVFGGDAPAIQLMCHMRWSLSAEKESRPNHTYGANDVVWDEMSGAYLLAWNAKHQVVTHAGYFAAA